MGGQLDATIIFALAGVIATLAGIIYRSVLQQLKEARREAKTYRQLFFAEVAKKDETITAFARVLEGGDTDELDDDQ